MKTRAQKKGPRPWQANGGDGGKPNTENLPQAPTDCKPEPNAENDILRRLIAHESGGEKPTLAGVRKVARDFSFMKAAFHESGHAGAYFLIGCPIERIVLFNRGGGLVQPSAGSILDHVGENFRFACCAGIAAELRFQGTPAPGLLNLTQYLKREHRPELLPPVETGIDFESDLLLMLNYYYPRRKYAHISGRKKRKFYADVSREIIAADKRLVEVWPLVQIIADTLLSVPCIEGALLRGIFRWWEMVGKFESANLEGGAV